MQFVGTAVSNPPASPLIPVPDQDRIEYGFQLPNGEIIWSYWNIVEERALSVVGKDGRVDPSKVRTVRETYERYLYNELGLTRAHINQLAPIMIVTRTQKVFYTRTEEVA